jgi:hypothetical protein
MPPVFSITSIVIISKVIISIVMFYDKISKSQGTTLIMQTLRQKKFYNMDPLVEQENCVLQLFWIL